MGDEIKRLYLIGGAMGVGKTAVSQRLKTELPNAVFLDGDWCWDASPFQATGETKDMIMDNIFHLLKNFIHCSAYENIIFCRVMHEQSVIDAILKKTDTAKCEVKVISLLAERESLTEKIMRDVKNGVRTADALERSLERMPLYQKLDSIKIETDGKSIEALVEEIIKL